MEYLLFAGENASTGTLNKYTGETSFGGVTHKFTSADARDKWIDTHGHKYATGILECGTRQTLRKYSRGISVRAHNEDIDCRDYSDLDD